MTSLCPARNPFHNPKRPQSGRQGNCVPFDGREWPTFLIALQERGPESLMVWQRGRGPERFEREIVEVCQRIGYIIRAKADAAHLKIERRHNAGFGIEKDVRGRYP